MEIPKTRGRLEMLALFGGSALLLLAALFFAMQYVQPAPPRSISIATGNPEGAYYRYAEQYRRLLAMKGIELEIVETAGSVENLKLLLASTEPPSEQQAEAPTRVDLAFVQGGVADAEQKGRLIGLGSMFYEPVWLLARAPAEEESSASPSGYNGILQQEVLKDTTAPRLNRLVGARIGIGSEDSGTKLLALQLLRANGITRENATLVTQGLEDAAAALRKGDLDLIFVVGSADSPQLRRLAEQADLVLQDLERAAAYARRNSFLTALDLPAGTIDLARNVPASDLNLVASTANLVAIPDIHPALVDLLLDAAAKVHGGGGLFASPGTFPSSQQSDFPLSRDAERHYKYGPPFLQRFLPFWMATWIDRTKVMLLPLVVLLFPLIKTLPPVYRWRIRRRIIRLYADLRKIDLDLQRRPLPPEALERLSSRLQEIEAQAVRIDVPLAYTDALFHLRLHIELLEQKLKRLANAETAA